MFNRQPFNRGKFNVSTTQSIGNSGIALMAIKTEPVKVNKIISANGKSEIAMKSDGNYTNIKYSSGKTEMTMTSNADGTKVFIVMPDMSGMTMGTHAEQVLAGESLIDLNGLILKPGDELIINTCDMTVLVNGQNGMEFFSADSDFFNLLSGDNNIIYSDTNSNRKISFDVIWKDRWL